MLSEAKHLNTRLTRMLRFAQHDTHNKKASPVYTCEAAFSEKPNQTFILYYGFKVTGFQDFRVTTLPFKYFDNYLNNPVTLKPCNLMKPI